MGKLAPKTQNLEKIGDAPDLLLDVPSVRLIGVRIEPVKPVQPVFRRENKARILQSVRNADRIPLTHRSAAGSALDGHPGAGAIERDRFLSQRENAVIFKKDKALRGDPPRKGAILYFQRRRLMVRSR